MTVEVDKLKERVKEMAKDGKLACRVAFQIAEEFEVPPRKVGDAANELKIKIAGCQLGCFK
ncbi:MAG: hypothetical protein GX058_00605 [Firmicutes bacterium]|nr:hypothetical protein [Bacillota bacterium]